MKNEILLIPDKPDTEVDALAAAWETAGGEVQQIGKFWVKPEVGDKRVSIYGYDSFCLVLAQLLEIQLIMPKDEHIAALPNKAIKRNISIKSIEAISEINFPQFIKSVTPKLIKAEVFLSQDSLVSKLRDVPDKELLICSEVIEITKEVRSFILDQKILDLAYYEGSGELEDPRVFIEQTLASCPFDLPKSFVLDIGFNEPDGWFVIEFNSAWGAGLNSCNPNKVLPCIREAATKMI